MIADLDVRDKEIIQNHYKEKRDLKTKLATASVTFETISRSLR